MKELGVRYGISARKPKKVEPLPPMIEPNSEPDAERITEPQQLVLAG